MLEDSLTQYDQGIPKFQLHIGGAIPVVIKRGVGEEDTVREADASNG